MKTKIMILLIIGLCGSADGLFAQNSSVKSLDECIQYALEHNLTLQSGRIAIEKAKDLQGSAFDVNKTNIALSQDPTSGGSPDNSLSLSQSFDFPTVYAARHRLLKAETQLESSRLEVSVNELVKEISSVYYNLLRAKEYIRILDEQDSVYARFRQAASARLKSGESGRLEWINAERLYNENKIELQKAQHEYRNIRITLQRWLNTDLVIEPDENTLPVLTLSVAGFDASQTPFGKVYENQLNVSEKNLLLQRQAFLPEINFTLRNQLLLKGYNPYNLPRERFDKGNFMGFEVGIGIPLFFGGQRSKAKAAAREVEIIRTEQENALLAMRKEYETRLNEYYRAKTDLDYYLLTGNKLAEEIERMAQLSYEKGEIGYIEYIQNLKSAVEMQLQYVNAVNAYNQSVIILNYLQGNKNN
jgi:cobalt-zinc-cadmium resistance protein CzcA